jgi:hypothetical protein
LRSRRLYQIPRSIIAEEILTFCCVNRKELAGNVDISSMHFSGLSNYQEILIAGAPQACGGETSNGEFC